MEIELKLAISPEAMSALRRHPALRAAPADKRRERTMRNVYFDTPEADLLRLGMALRLRRAGRDWLQTLKLEAQGDGIVTQRPEWELPLSRGRLALDLFPPEARALLARVDLSALRPVFSTDFHRQTWLVDWQGATLEVALDEGLIHAEGGEGGADMPIRELEIELKAGEPALIYDFARQLTERVPLALEPRSKAARGYALAGIRPLGPVRISPRLAAPESPARDAGPSAHAVWRSLASSALAQVIANVPGFLERPEEIEFLHQLRVGLRRMLVVSGLAKSLDGATPAWAAELKALMRVLSAARDWDVFMAEGLPRALKLLGETELAPAARAVLEQSAQTARAAAQTAVASARITAVFLDIGRDLLREPRADEAAPASPPASAPDERAQDWAQRALAARWRRLAARGKGWRGFASEDWHRVRLAAKAMRYNADALATLFSDTSPFMRRLERLQTELGALQDAAAALRLLSEIKPRSPAVAYQLGRLAGALAAAQHACPQDHAKAWTALARSPRFWRAG